jgi:hypothetical protein
MFQPRRLRTRRASSVENDRRKPSHFSSKDHPEPEGSGPGRDSIGSGSRSTRSLVRSSIVPVWHFVAPGRVLRLE